MKKVLQLLAVFLVFFVTEARSQGMINVNVSAPVTFDQILLPGASAQSLKIYSEYALDKVATFGFGDVTIGDMKHCRYILTCEKGKITSICLTVMDGAAGKALKAFTEEHFGKPEQELLQKKNGIEERGVYTFKANGLKADLNVETDKQAFLTVK